MKLLAIALLTMSLTAFAERKHQKSEEPSATRETVPGVTPFQECESRVIPLSKKHFGQNNRNAMAFHTMMACAGLEGDPVEGRKGWKSYLPACPATPPNSVHWKQDPFNSVQRYHPCAEMCFKRSAAKPWRHIIHEERTLIGNKPELQRYAWYRFINQEEWNILDIHFPGQQCCYRSGKLITNGAAAGTPDIIFRSPNHTPIRFRGTGPLRAALSHERFDVAIINENFTRWPQGWREYFQLGWAPTELPGTLQYTSLPEDAPCTSDSAAQSAPH